MDEFIHLEKEPDPIEQKIAIQMISFSIAIIVIILTLISFIRIYSEKKEQILKELAIESELLETVITDNLNYSRYFIDIIGKNIQNNPQNLGYIKKVLNEHFTSPDFNMLFGWRKYSWINNEFLEVVTSTKGVTSTPKKMKYITNLINNKSITSDNWENKVIFYTSHKENKNDSLKIINNISNKKNTKYIGSVILSYDINTMIRNLNKRKKSKSTNFVIINKDLEIVAKSKPSISNIINKNSDLDPHLQNILKQVNLKQQWDSPETSFLDMINGVNYFITPLQGLPFIMIVNIDNNIIKHDIIDNITKKFIEVCIFAATCLFVIAFIYRRETFLRTKAEKATLVARDSTKAKTDFLAFTAHEIRSPLGFISTGSELMQQELMGPLPEPYKKYVDGIHENANTILAFITDILDESQIIGGKFKIINNISSVADIINESIEYNRARYSKRNIEIIVNIADNFPMLICDKRRILQIFNNLISNSIKYSDDNTIITVTGEIVQQQMELKVIDQGMGMQDNDFPIALSPYGTLNNSDYHYTGSYGLGLAIVQMLVDAHDAKLNVSSAKNKGTTMKITFPQYKLIYNSTKTIK